MRLLKGLTAGCLLAALAACNTTTGVGHLNPQYSNLHLSRVAVAVEPRTELSEKLEASLVQALEKQGLKAYKTSEITRFATTDAAVANQVQALGATELLYVGLSDSKNSHLIGAQTTAYTNGNTTNATTLPMVGSSRRMEADLAIYTTPSDGDAAAFKGTARREAGGVAFVGDDSMIANITDGVLQSLKDGGVLNK